MFLSHFGQYENRHARDRQNVAMHQPRTESSCIWYVAEEFRMIVRHAYVVDQDANIQVLNLGSDSVIDFTTTGKIHVDNASLDSVSGFYSGKCQIDINYFMARDITSKYGNAPPSIESGTD